MRYKDDDHKIKPLCIMLPKTRHTYVKSYDGILKKIKLKYIEKEQKRWLDILMMT